MNTENAPARRTLIAGFILVLALSGCGQQDFVDAEGNAFDWDDFKGQWLAVNYWAEWCAPCLEEIPELNRLHARSGRQVLGVNFDRPELVELRRQMNALSVEFPVIHVDNKQRLTDQMPAVLPTTYLFDPQGQLRHTLTGAQTLAGIEAIIEGTN